MGDVSIRCAGPFETKKPSGAKKTPSCGIRERAYFVFFLKNML
jgi:hypothetical protein